MLDGYMMGFKAGYLFCICATVFFFFFLEKKPYFSFLILFRFKRLWIVNDVKNWSNIIATMQCDIQLIVIGMLSVKGVQILLIPRLIILSWYEFKLIQKKQKFII